MSFMPHGYCFAWDPILLWVYGVSDLAIFAAYYSIPLIIWYFTHRRRDLPYRWAFNLVGLFVLACGTTHLIAVINLWQPYYWLDASFKGLTALVSLAAAFALIRILPRALLIPSRAELEALNQRLSQEVVGRNTAESELLQLNGELEARVAARTEELTATNARLARSNLALETISSCNSVLIHAKSENTLLEQMCEVIVSAGYLMSWVGFLALDSTHPYAVRSVAQAGASADYLEREPVSWDDNSPSGRGPSGSAIRSQLPVKVDDTWSDPSYTPWKEHSLACGYRSLLAVPLRSFGQALGVLVIYSSRVADFPAEECALLGQLADDLAFGLVSLRDRQCHEDNSQQLLESMEGAIAAIAATMEMRDRYTSGHQLRVAELSQAIAREMGLPQDEIHGIYLAAQIHDIGKIHVPAEILNKPGRLSDLEMGLVKTHPQSGYDILKNVKFPWPIAEMVYQHHERMDGSGYPNRLAGNDLLLGSRIIAVADVVEAMASHRPYRAGLGIEVALAEIAKFRGVYFDPTVTDACFNLFRVRNFTLPS